MIRHARVTLLAEELDELHGLKRRLARERGTRLTIDEMIHEAVEMLLRYHGRPSDPEPKPAA
jgi:hypothetical protein